MLLPMKFRIKSSVFASNVALWLLIIFEGISYEIHGIENIPDGHYIVASKHQSSLETFILMTIFRNPVYVLKKELKIVPLFGFHFIMLKMIFVNREGGISALRNMLKYAQKRVAENRSIIIFPEGARIPVGAKSNYQPGIAMLYKELSIPVIPVALNTGKFFTQNHRIPGKSIINILQPIMPGLSKKEFLKELEDTIETNSKLLI